MPATHHPKRRFRNRFLLTLAVIFFVFDALFIAINRDFVVREMLTRFHLPRVAAVFGASDPELLFKIGNYYFGGSQEYDVDRAESLFRRVIALDPRYPGGHYQLGRTLFIKGDMYDAERELSEELRVHPDFWRSHYVRALIRGYAGDLLGAAEDFNEFLRHSPQSWAAHNDLAWIYFRMGEYKKVRDVALDGLKYVPESPWLNNSLGIALMNLGDKEGARRALEKAQRGASGLTRERWGAAYPGNDPRVYGVGLEAMRSSIEENLALLNGTSSPRGEPQKP